MRIHYALGIRSEGDLAAERAVEVLLDGLGLEVEAEEVHQLGDGGLAGDVVSADGAGSGEAVAGLVEGAAHTTIDALGDIEDDDAALTGRSDLVDEPLLAGAVASAVGFEDDALDAWRGEQVVQGLRRHAGVELEEHDSGVHVVAHLEGPV